MLLAPKQRVELTGARGGPVETKGVTNAELARRIAFIRRQAEDAIGKEPANGLCTPRNQGPKA